MGMSESILDAGKCELDTHADTWCVGEHSLVLYDTGRTVTVSPFLESLGEVEKVSIVQAAIAYDDPNYSRTVVLIINQALHFPNMHRNLACPNQSRVHGVEVFDTPRHLDPHRHELSHSIYFPSDKFAIPLHLDRVISYFHCRKPSQMRLIHVPISS